MSVPASSTYAGPLELVETYVFYEGPRLFCAQAAAGQRYLGIFVEEEDDRDTYLYVPMSAERFVAVRSGLLSVRDATINAEVPILVVTATYDSDGTSDEVCQTLDGPDIPEEWLADPSSFLQLPTRTQAPFDPFSLSRRSTAEGRTLLGVRLPDSSLRTEYSARDIVSIVGRVQDSTSSLGQELRGNPTTAGMIPGDVLEATELAIVDLQAASFVVILAPTSPVAQLPLESPLARRSLDFLLDLAEAAGDEAALRTKVSSLHRRAKKKIHDFFESVVDVGDSVTLALAPPNNVSRNVELTVSAARNGLAILAETEEDTETLPAFVAHLIGVNLRTKAFEVNRLSDREKYAGGMDPAALDMIRGLPTGEEHRYVVVIRREITVDSITGEERPRFRLVSIAPAPGSQSPS